MAQLAVRIMARSALTPPEIAKRAMPTKYEYVPYSRLAFKRKGDTTRLLKFFYALGISYYCQLHYLEQFINHNRSGHKEIT